MCIITVLYCINTYRLTGIPIGDPRVQRKSVRPVITVIEAAHVVKNIA